MQNIGRYEVIDELGRGAMGVVYRARDTQIGRIVALKMILTTNASPQEVERFKQRFQREAQAAGRLTHPGIVAVHDIAEDEYGQPYIVQEFVEGRQLNLLLGPATELPLDQLLDIGIQVAQALDYAHKNGVIHRDIKPPNILVTPDGRAKIADFGIARLEGTELTQEGTSLGTPSYMSPEQFRGGAIDGRSDIFSLGAVLYWMFTGKKPFPGDTVTITSFQVAFENPVLPSLAKTDLPKDLDDILTRCLAKNPESRYATCGDLAADLDAVRHGRPLPARLAAKPESTGPFPLPSRRTEQARSDPAIQAPAADPDAKTRVAISTGQFASRKPYTAKPSAPSRVNPVLLLVGGGGIALLLVLGVGLWIRNHPGSAPGSSAPASAPAQASSPVIKPPAETPTPATSSSPSDNASGESAASATPSTEPVALSPAPPKKRARENSAPSTSPAPISSQQGPASTPPPVDQPPAPVAKPLETPPPPAPVVFSKLDLECRYPFKQGTLEITIDGNPFLQEKLEGKNRKFGLVGNYKFEAKDHPIPVGQHKLRVRLAGKDGKPAWDDTLPVTIAKDASNRLEISLKEGADTDPDKKKLVLSLSTVK